MTMHQAKGREMDAVVLVHHPEDVFFDNRGTEPSSAECISSCFLRARQTATVILPPNPNAFLYSAYADMANPQG